MAEVDNDYTVGRGKIYFDRFLDNTKTKTGERYFGNTPSFEPTQNVTTLDHYGSDYASKEKDASVNLQNDVQFALTCDNIQDDNLALWWLGIKDTVVLTAMTGQTQVADSVLLGTYIQLGVSADQPEGFGHLAGVTSITNDNGTKASGTVTVAVGNVVANDTVTIGTTTITYVVSGPTAGEIVIGADNVASAQALLAYVNLHSATLGVNATGTSNVITIHANNGGVAGNSIALAKSGTNLSVSGATLTGGTANATVSTSDYDVDLVTGRVYLHPDAGDVHDGDAITITYDTTDQTVARILSQGKSIYGAIRFVADNAVGTNRNYYLPYVKISPNGNYALKGDAWAVMTFSVECLKLNSTTDKVIKY
jgi:hypothetical protein